MDGGWWKEGGKEGWMVDVNKAFMKTNGMAFLISRI
jgi:hypothetical protein